MGWIRTSTEKPEAPVLEKSELKEYLQQLVWEVNFRSLCEEYPAEGVLWIQDITLTSYETERKREHNIFVRARDWLRRLFQPKK